RTADRATPSPRPNAWRVQNLVLAAIPLALFKLVFCIAVLAFGAFRLHLTSGALQTLTFTMLVFAGQGMNFVLRERGPLWTSRPSTLMMSFSLMDIAIISTVAITGFLTPSLPVRLILELLGATVLFLLAIDQVKVVLLRYMRID
ncbi:MAG TPA: hypothetical protein VMU22_13250, partial [Rhizomicrobium sp.]|nr:hypothetical protein [Rhizomicrobium sp.]